MRSLVIILNTVEIEPIKVNDNIVIVYHHIEDYLGEEPNLFFMLEKL